jgi:tRNA pseudouridine55 synthase
VRFGVATSTLDAAGDVLDRVPMSTTREQVEAAAQGFVGDIEQIPPMVSAVKVGGRRLHELARAGEEVERPVRRVRVDAIDVEDFEPGPYPLARIVVACSSGTYIRTLAADLGVALGGCAHLESLRRTRVGSFTLEESHPLIEIEADPPAAVLAPSVAMRDLESVAVDEETARAVRHGATFTAGALSTAGDGPYAVVDADGMLLAVYERHGAGVKPSVVVAPTETS